MLASAAMLAMSPHRVVADRRDSEPPTRDPGSATSGSQTIEVGLEAFDKRHDLPAGRASVGGLVGVAVGDAAEHLFESVVEPFTTAMLRRRASVVGCEQRTRCPRPARRRGERRACDRADGTLAKRCQAPVDRFDPQSRARLAPRTRPRRRPGSGDATDPERERRRARPACLNRLPPRCTPRVRVVSRNRRPGR